uniref:Uncharacterized protein n=1 Tax=Tanacetum cinerariifolium TaxID=118510 RepID=A0A699K003_TANCI|nr:hypothetical protein [Tanacetum cinerariifolium]
MFLKKTSELDTGQAGSDPGKTLESRPPPDDDKMAKDQAGSNPGKSHVALAGSNPEPMHDNFVAIVYPKVHESLKFLADEQVILEDPLNEPGKPNVNAEVVSMVTVLIHQASLLVPPLSTPIIDLSPPKPVASHLLEPFITATTKTTTTTLLLLPPPQQQSITDLELASRVTALEKKFSDFENKSQTLDKKTPNLRSRQSTPYSDQPVKDMPIPDDVNISDLKDIDTAHLPKIKTRPDWLKPVPEEDRPETPEPDWIIPLPDLPDAENN